MTRLTQERVSWAAEVAGPAPARPGPALRLSKGQHQRLECTRGIAEQCLGVALCGGSRRSAWDGAELTQQPQRVFLSSLV